MHHTSYIHVNFIIIIIDSFFVTCEIMLKKLPLLTTYQQLSTKPQLTHFLTFLSLVAHGLAHIVSTHFTFIQNSSDGVCVVSLDLNLE